MHCSLLDSLQVGHITQARRLGHPNCALRRHRNLWVDDILVPETLAGRNIAWQGKAWQSRHSDIVGAANPGLQHASAPHRYVSSAADVVHLLRRGETAHTS